MVGTPTIFLKNLQAIYSLFQLILPEFVIQPAGTLLGISQKTEMTSQLELLTVAHLSLEERAAKYSAKYDTKIARRQLRLLYAEHGITKKMVAKRRAWRRPSDLKNIAKDAEMLANIKSKISKIQAENGEIIMIDECLFNQKQVMKTAWMVAGTNVIPAVMWPSALRISPEKSNRVVNK